jgi:RNA polymerase sigma factor (sigma-70 family)
VREAELDALMGRLAQGDRTAFDPLHAGLRPRALRLARVHVGPTEALDVTQTAMLKVFSRASEFVPGRPCLPWFYAVVSNEIRAARRSRRGGPLLPETENSLPSDDAGAEVDLARRELERALELAIAELDDTSAQAVAAMLGRAARPAVSPQTFRKRLSRAYGRLRLLLGEHDGS